MPRLELPERECIERVEKVVSAAATIVLGDLRNNSVSPLQAFIDKILSIAKDYGTPCINIHSAEEYVVLLHSKKVEIQQSVLDRAMAAIAKYVEELPGPLYGRLSLLMVEYASHVMEAISLLIDSIGASDMDIICIVDELLFAILLRFNAVCWVVERLGVSKLVKSLRRLEKLIESYIREEKLVLEGLKLVAASQPITRLGV